MFAPGAAVHTDPAGGRHSYAGWHLDTDTYTDWQLCECGQRLTEGRCPALPDRLLVIGNR